MSMVILLIIPWYLYIFFSSKKYKMIWFSVRSKWKENVEEFAAEINENNR